MNIGLVWLENDLRLHDNAMIVAAAKKCDYLVFLRATCDFPAYRGQSYDFGLLGKHRKQFLHQSLSDFSQSLKLLGQKLFFIESASERQLIKFIHEHHITDIFHSQTADYDHNIRINNIATKFPQIEMHSFNTYSLFEDLPMLSLPKVFTQFRQHIEKNCFLLRQPQLVIQHDTIDSLPPMPEQSTNEYDYHVEFFEAGEKTFFGGEKQALQHLQSYFNSDAPRNYKNTRNDLDGWFESTKFSAWLAHGNVSVRTLLSMLKDYEKRVCENDSTYWIWFELLWREYFYWYAETHGKKLFTFKGITSCKQMSCFYGERYERWKNGNTPYPIVNACMNQLRQTGYMSNRGRQLAASCFVNELGMDWRYGASYFEQQLIDYDVASNWGNWQYIAGVGADPRGGRKFDLVKQTQQYDQHHAFIDKWSGDSGATHIDSVDAADWPIG